MISDLLDHLTALPGWAPRPPEDERAIEKVGKRFRLALPEDYLTFMRFSDGATVGEVTLEDALGVQAHCWDYKRKLGGGVVFAIDNGSTFFFFDAKDRLGRGAWSVWATSMGDLRWRSAVPVAPTFRRLLERALNGEELLAAAPAATPEPAPRTHPLLRFLAKLGDAWQPRPAPAWQDRYDLACDWGGDLPKDLAAFTEAADGGRLRVAGGELEFWPASRIRAREGAMTHTWPIASVVGTGATLVYDVFGHNCGARSTYVLALRPRPHAKKLVLVGRTLTAALKRLVEDDDVVAGVVHGMKGAGHREG